jgi:preprotein translocase subunit SecB
MLYGLAREVIRNLTAQGPFPPILIPTVSFYDREDQDTTSPEAEAKVAEDSPTYGEKE